MFGGYICSDLSMSCHLEWEASLRIQAQNLFQAASHALDDMLKSVACPGGSADRALSW